jgi:pilus assembly protein CpaC
MTAVHIRTSKSGPRSTSGCRWWPAAGAALLTLLAPTAAAQDGGASDVAFSVSEVDTAGRLVRVPVNKSVMINFSAPVREARMAKADIAEVSAVAPRQILLTGKTFGTTQLIVWLNEKDQRVFDVAVDIEMERLLASIRAAAPRARVKAHALLDSVVLTGVVGDADSAKRIMEIASIYSPKVMNQMRVAGTQQVMLRVTVAEVNRRAGRQLGFNGWMAGKQFPTAFGASNLDGINPANIGAPAGALASGGTNIPFLVGEDGIPVTARSTLTVGFPELQMQVFVQALRENGLLRVLAEPTLVALNGQEANFHAGGEYPVPIPSDQGIGIEYREFGIKLNFTPVVVSENTIRMKVMPEVSEPDFTTAVTVLGTTVPGLAKRKVETTVELGSGQTLAIGGLLSERVRAVSRSVPGLGDVPVIGALFRSVEYQSDESELVVLVTPELVEPLSPNQVTYVPGARHLAPNDFELFLLGLVEGQSGSERQALQARVNHSWPVTAEEQYGGNAGDDVALKLRGPLGPAAGDEGM